MLYDNDVCFTALAQCNEGEVRLANGSSSNEGIEVCTCGSKMSCSWDTVCMDAQVPCRQLGDRSERWLNIIISVDIINVHTVLITWKLLNSTLSHWPNSYVVECFSMRHRIELLVNNATFSAQLMGLVPGTSYNCCISALYVYDHIMYTHKRACTEEYVTVQPSSDEISSNADVVGGVLGTIIIILVILLAILSGIILSYIYYLRRQGSVTVIPEERYEAY